MKVFLKLVKIMLSAVEPGEDEKKKSNRFYAVAGAVVMLLIILPITVGAGYLVFIMTDALIKMGLAFRSTAGFNLMCLAISTFSFIFGFGVVLNVFYFSSDLSFLLPLPVKPFKLVAAKFASTLISENMMQALLVLGVTIGFLIPYGLTASGFFAAVLGVLTLPVIPLCYSGIISIVLMSCTRIIKNKGAAIRLTLLLSVLFFVALLFGSGILNGGLDAETATLGIILEGTGIFGALSYVFYYVNFLSAAMMGDFLGLLYYVLINVGAVGIMLFLASKLYLKSVTRISGASVGRKAHGELAFKQSNVKVSYFRKEIRTLLRTPAYLTNCVLINLLWPILLVVFLVFVNKSDFLIKAVTAFRVGNGTARAVGLIIVTAISALITGLSSIGGSAISREGRHCDFMKYVPLSYKTQLNCKALLGILFGYGGLFVYIIVTAAVIKIDVGTVFLYLIVSFFTVVSVNYFGLYLDTKNPKLIWDDEMNALRGNFNVFINMALSMVATAVVCALIYVLVKFANLPVLAAEIALLIVLAATAFCAYYLCTRKGAANIKALDV